MANKDAGKNSTGVIEGFGVVHCASEPCRKPIAYFPPDVEIDEDDNLELYCYDCGLSLAKKCEGDH